MSEFLKRIGIPFVWGTNLSNIKKRISGPSFQEKIRMIRIKKMQNPESRVSEELKGILREEIK